MNLVLKTLKIILLKIALEMILYENFIKNCYELH